MLQARHEAVQAVLQQTPSGAHVVPEMQPPDVAVQDWPRLLLQAPAVSQVPTQLSVSAALITAAQVPFAFAQV
jgi:hypothetical protein